MNLTNEFLNSSFGKFLFNDPLAVMIGVVGLIIGLAFIFCLCAWLMRK